MKNKSNLVQGLFKQNKKAQGVFDMSFTMIFSIILIVFFVVVAFIALRYFFNYQANVQIGMFFNDFNSQVSKAFNAEKASYTFNSTLPSGIQFVCIINANSEMENASKSEQEVYNYVIKKETADFTKNVYLYAPGKNYGLKWKQISNIKAIRNPQCYNVTRGIVSIRLQRDFQNPYVLLK